MESAFGVDHGEIAKYLDTAAAGGIGAISGAQAARKGKKKQAAALNATTTSVGHLTGTYAGSELGYMATRGHWGGAVGGGLAGGVLGALSGNSVGRQSIKDMGWGPKKKRKGRSTNA